MGGSRNDITQLADKAETYCEALWASDVERLREVFDKSAQLYGEDDGALAIYSVEEWLSIVAARAPGEGSAPFTILGVDVAASDLASTTVECAATGKRFTDILNFVKIGGEWRVVAKLFHLQGDG